MGDQKSELKLQERIQQLEQEVKEREQDIARFRAELMLANRRLESLIEKINSELKIVESLQRALVPTELPHMSGLEFSTKFIPSSISGGDYFDIFAHDDPMHFGVVVASSSGYSTSALFMSVLLKISGRMEARRGSSPHEIINEMAKEIMGGLGPQDKIDIFYGLVDRRNFDLHYCRLGNITAVVHDFNRGELKLLSSSSAAIDRNFRELEQSFKLALHPRDRMIVCSRGIVEAQNETGEFFGNERIFSCISADSHSGVHEIRNRILYEVQKFSTLPEPNRDQTIMVAEVKDRVIMLAKP